jgi:GT2 family glycosyltransferase
MIDIIIVNWNSGIQLGQCVESIAKYGNGLVSQVIVVDNGSHDGSDASVEGRGNLKLIRAGTNLGFGRACNVGAQHASSDYLLFLNPDAALYERTLEKCFEYMNDTANAEVGICGVQLVDERDHLSRSCARFPSPARLIAQASGVDRFVPSTGAAMVEWDHSQLRNVDQVIGAFFLVRHELFTSLQGFDERFFVYFEEVDFSYRARRAGWCSVYLAGAQAFHAGGGTSRQVKARRLFYSLRSRLLYAFKHFSLGGAVLVLIATLLVEPFSRSGYGLLRGSGLAIKETLGAYAMLWRWLPQWAFKGASR